MSPVYFPSVVRVIQRGDYLDPPVDLSTNIAPQKGGVAIHYGGPDQKIKSHADCITRAAQWQEYHMDVREFADLAYNALFCDHGYFFEGRGIGVRSAANGTNDANYRYYAMCWIGGGDKEPTYLAYCAALWGIELFRDHGAGLEVKPHSTFKATDCPGAKLRGFAYQYDGKLIIPKPEMPDEVIPVTPSQVTGDKEMFFAKDLSTGAIYLVRGEVMFRFKTPEDIDQFRDCAIAPVPLYKLSTQVMLRLMSGYTVVED